MVTDNFTATDRYGAGVEPAKPRHTPGPWTITGMSIETGSISVGHKDRRIVIADVTNAASIGDMLAGAIRRGSGPFSSDDATTQWANARLIAAAPDLLAALITADALLARVEGGLTAPAILDARFLIADTIAKATTPEPSHD